MQLCRFYNAGMWLYVSYCSLSVSLSHVQAVWDAPTQPLTAYSCSMVIMTMSYSILCL